MMVSVTIQVSLLWTAGPLYGDGVVEIYYFLWYISIVLYIVPI